MVTLTCALVQQHWNPPPPSPERSLTCARTMYSPGAENVAVVETLPSFSTVRTRFGKGDVAGPAELAPDESTIGGCFS